MRLFLNISLIALCISLVSCSKSVISEDQLPERTPQDLTVHEKELIGSTNRFTYKLIQEINKPGNNANIFVSPLSASYALGMAYNGSMNETKDAIKSCLDLSELSDEEFNSSFKSLTEYLLDLDNKVTIDIANSIWYRDSLPVKDSFIDINSFFFKAKTEALDFNDIKSSEIINKWVSESTNDKINEIVNPPINPQTMMFLINAIYFKADWTVSFDPENTYQSEFYVTENNIVNCQMMVLDTELEYYENDLFQSVQLRYNNGYYRATVYLPAKGVELKSVLEQFDDKNRLSWIDKYSNTDLKLTIPKFKFSYKLPLNDALINLGMGIAFDPIHADFSNIAEVNDLHISKVVQKAFVQFDEQGTEAAAITSIEVGVTSIGPEKNSMFVNRPFFFTIEESESNTIIFVGVTNNPVWEK